MYGTSKKSVPEFGGSTPNLGETHEDGKVKKRAVSSKKNLQKFLTKPLQHRGEGTIPAQQQPRKSKSGVLFGNSNYPGDGEYDFKNH